MQTEEQYHEAQRRFLQASLMIVPLGCLIGLVVLTLVYSSLAIGLYGGIPLGFTLTSASLFIMDSLIGPSSKKWEGIRKQRRERTERSKRQAPGHGARPHWYRSLSKWQQAGLWSVGCGVLFSVAFGVVSGEGMMFVGGLVIGLISGPVLFKSVNDPGPW